MKPSSTPSLLKVLAFMLCTLAIFHTQEAKADCGFTFATNDTIWTFSTPLGTIQTRSLTIVNTSSESLVLNIAVSGADA
ncbi:MAG: hypothetical protein Q8896_05100, partial [Bacteroidota bacterium]|nr:hypothetical protein [Bacteroidota bacterium]